MHELLSSSSLEQNIPLTHDYQNNTFSQLALGHVAICVRDLVLATKFYQSLGLKLSYQTADMAYLYSGKQGIALMRIGSKQAHPHFGFACTSVKEVEQIHHKLKNQGLSVTPIEYMGPAAAFYGQDLDGNWFEYIYEPTPDNTYLQPKKKSRKKLKAKGFG